jgi:LmbE family N-acetylglucosaminyl deacetylase
MLKAWFFRHLVLRLFNLYLRLNLKPTTLDVSQYHGLVLAPHPDDESIGMGGTLALFPQHLEVACLSNGNRGVKSVEPSQAGALRQQELQAALALAGIHTHHWLNIPDGAIAQHYAVFKTLPLSTYNLLFVPNVLDQHPDHKAVAQHVYRYFKEHTPPPQLQLAFYEVWNTHPLPNAFVDISAVANTKQAMIEAHASQVAKKAFGKVLSLNQYRGLQRDVASAEAFCVVDLPTFNRIVEGLMYFAEQEPPPCAPTP